MGSKLQQFSMHDHLILWCIHFGYEKDCVCARCFLVALGEASTFFVDDSVHRVLC